VIFSQLGCLHFHIHQIRRGCIVFLLLGKCRGLAIRVMFLGKVQLRGFNLCTVLLHIHPRFVTYNSRLIRVESIFLLLNHLLLLYLSLLVNLFLLLQCPPVLSQLLALFLLDVILVFHKRIRVPILESSLLADLYGNVLIPLLSFCWHLLLICW